MKLRLPICLCLLVCWNIASATISYEKVSFERRKPPRQEGFGTCTCGFTLVTLKLPLKDLDKKFGSLKRYHTCMKNFRPDLCELPNICGFCIFKMTTCCRKEDGIYSCTHGHISIRNKEESGSYPAQPGGLGQPLASPWDFPAPSQYYSSGGNPNPMGNLGGYPGHGFQDSNNQGLFPAPPRGFGPNRFGQQGASVYDPQIPYSQFPYPGGNPIFISNSGGYPGYGSEESQYRGLSSDSSGRFGQAAGQAAGQASGQASEQASGGWDSQPSYFQNPSLGGNMNARTNAGGFPSYESEDRYFHGGDGGDNVNWMEIGQRWSVPVENYGIYLPVVTMGSGFYGGMEKSKDNMDVGGPIWEADEFIDEDFKDKIREKAAKAIKKGTEVIIQGGKPEKEEKEKSVEAEADSSADSSAESDGNSAKAESSASASSGEKAEAEESRRKRRDLKVGYAEQWLGAIKGVFGFDDSKKTTPKKIVCLVPNLVTADVKCKEKRKSVKCTRTCKKGFTEKHGKTRKFKCNKSVNQWKPHHFGECYASSRTY